MDKVFKKAALIACLIHSLLLFACSSFEKVEYYEQFVTVLESDTKEDIIEKVAHLIPSECQMAWQELEFTCFICLGVNTFTDREWGTGKEDPAIFNPSQLDARQWCKTAKDAGMKLMLLTTLILKEKSGFVPGNTHSIKVN